MSYIVGKPCNSRAQSTEANLISKQKLRRWREETMDKLDKTIKSSLVKSLQQQAGSNCPSSGDALADYIAGGLSANERQTIEKHASECKDCLWKISTALKADALNNNKEAKMRPVKKHNLWLLLTIIAFTSSFLFPRYFLQCLVATILVGIKWITDSENMRTLILVLDSWRKHEHSRDENISERLRDRNSLNDKFQNPNDKSIFK